MCLSAAALAGDEVAVLCDGEVGVGASMDAVEGERVDSDGEEKERDRDGAGTAETAAIGET